MKPIAYPYKHKTYAYPYKHKTYMAIPPICTARTLTEREVNAMPDMMEETVREVVGTTTIDDSVTGAIHRYYTFSDGTSLVQTVYAGGSVSGGSGYFTTVTGRVSINADMTEKVHDDLPDDIDDYKVPRW